MTQNIFSYYKDINDYKKLKIEHNLYINLYLILIPVLFILFCGYSFGESDHETYIPEVMHAFDPGYYPHDYIFDNAARHFSYFIPLTVTLFKIAPFPLEVLFFAGYLICLFFIFWAVYHIALNLFNSRATAALSVILLLSPSLVAGTAINTIENYFSIRIAALTVALPSLLFLISNRYYRASIFCGLTFLIHPLTALPLLGVFFIRLFMLGLFYDKKVALIASAIFFFISMPLIFSYFSFSETQQIISETHLKIIQFRAPYIFISEWYLPDIISFISYALLLLLMLINKPYINDTSSILFDFTIVWGTLCITGFLFTDVWPNHLIIQLQLYRSTIFIVFFISLYLSHYLITILDRNFMTPSGTQTIISQARFSVVLFLSLTVVLLHLFIKDYLLITVLFLVLLIYSNQTRLNIVLLLLTAVVVSISVGEINVSQYKQAIPVYCLIILALFLSYYVFTKAIPLSAKPTIVFVLFFCNIVIISKTFTNYREEPDSFLYKQINLPGRLAVDPWVDVCIKCKENIEKDETFFIPPFTRHFRVLSERSPVVNFKDGTFSIFSEKLAYQWYLRMRDFKNYNALKKADFNMLSKKYYTRFIITENTHVLDYPVLYQNNQYRVYSIE